MAEINTPSMGSFGATWEAKGYYGGGSVASLIDSLRGRPAVVCGNSADVFDDLAAARALLRDPVVFAVNDAGMYINPVDHWVSLHADSFPAWKAVRWLHPVEGEGRIHSIEAKPAVDVAWLHLTPVFALSGYFAAQVAWLMGCSPIVLCGCPGEPARRFFEASARDDFGYGGGPAQSDANVREQVVKEFARLPEFKAAVRSMSGWTKSYFGALTPTEEPRQ